MDKVLSPFKQGRLLNTLFFSNVFLGLHYALIVYINSSYLSNFFSTSQVSSLYIIASVVDMILLLAASRILEKIGNYKFIMYCLILEFLALLGLTVSSLSFLIGFYFLIHTIVISLLLFGFDLYIEDFTQDHEETGSIRATYLTITNITLVIAPSIVAFLLISNHYQNVYALSSVLLIPLYFLVRRYKGVKIDPIKHIYIKETLSQYIRDKNLYNIFVTQFLLQSFYAFMIVYTPVYLNTVIGFSWTEIGVMFTIMLLPFIFFELPVGELADLKYGEKEFLTIGFIIMGLATLFISFITVKIFWIWATVLFITRIGASFVEIASDSYFFKQVDKEKTDVISFFRVSRPISFIVTPVIATIMLQFIPFQYTFIIIGSIMIIGTHHAMALKDTK